MERLTSRLVEWLKDKAGEAGAKGLVVGMSGGIDSSVVAILCKRSFAETTLGLLLPCHSIPDDTEHARLVAEKFNIPTETVVLDSVYDSLMSVLPPDGREHRKLAESNLKPRLRMATIYFFANRLGYLVVGSSNRCELSVGYFSKYGDGGVDVMPLGNLVKSQVRDLARHLGVPQVIIDKPPSAGLWAGQTDEQEMGLTYDQLDTYFTTGKAPEAVRRKIEERIARNAHKRAPAPIPPF
ncbi:MAG: NAD(+) synthase [Dehalococcoidia bacterium]|nr:NAD(+) synthase [Dehalococcoidia bacterium]